MHTNTENSTGSASSTSAAKVTRKKRATRSKRAARSSARSTRTGSKLEAARPVFERLMGKKPRKDVIEAMVEKVGLTPATASAYYQRLAHEFGLKPGRVPRATYVRADGGETKAEVARQIFKKMGGRKPRKDVIDALVKEAKLTPAGASTYYQKLKQDQAAA